MAQNDPHAALNILTAHIWGGGGVGEKRLFRAKICVPVPWAPTSALTQNKGPGAEAHFWNPPPPQLRRAPMPSPPPPTAKQFSGRPSTAPCPTEIRERSRLDKIQITHLRDPRLQYPPSGWTTPIGCSSSDTKNLYLAEMIVIVAKEVGQFKTTTPKGTTTPLVDITQTSSFKKEGPDHKPTGIEGLDENHPRVYLDPHVGPFGLSLGCGAPLLA